MTLKPRARRRQDRWRMVQKAVRLLRMWDAPKQNVLSARGLDVLRPAYEPERMADNLAICSCRMCRNRRPTEGPTRRERRFVDA